MDHGASVRTRIRELVRAGRPLVFAAALLVGPLGGCIQEAPPRAAATIPAYADRIELREAAQDVVDRFAPEVAALGLELGPAPTVEVRTEPVRIDYDGNDGRIVVPWWEDLGPDERAAFTSFAGGDEHLPDPTPPGEDVVEYFSANVWELAADPMVYGYYQFRFMLDTVRERDGLELAAMIPSVAEDQ